MFTRFAGNFRQFMLRGNVFEFMVAFAIAGDGRILIATGDPWRSSGDGVYFSDDGGTRWVAASMPTPWSMTSSVAQRPGGTPAGTSSVTPTRTLISPP